MLDGMYSSQGCRTALLHAPDPKSIHREDHPNRRGSPYRPPRRAQSTIDYVYPSPPPLVRGESRTVLIQQSSAHTGSHAGPHAGSHTNPSPSAETAASPPTAAHPERPPTIDEEASAKPIAAAPAGPAPRVGDARPVRPKLGPPRRSYSVMDYEPDPHHHRLSDNIGLCDLPAELHYVLFDFLDPIDSTCLGLTNKHFYAIHRRMHGSVPLSVRRSGPNDMEWVWHLAGRMMQQGGHSEAAKLAATTNALAMLRVRGQALCRKCGVSRCELHKHIQGWMGPGFEYCTVREKFGPAAPEGAKEFCYLSNPKDPHRCGRHRVAKSRPSSPL